jgi:hypothetical protein
MSTWPEDGRCVEPQCRVRLRKSQQRLAQHPGTRVHAGAGLCYTCWRKRAVLTEAQRQALVAEVSRYLASRGRRASV